MRVVCGTDVVLDLMLERDPHVEAAAELLSRVERGGATAFLCGVTMTAVAAAADRLVGPERGRKELRKLLMLFDVAPLNRLVLERAVASEVADFEDAVIHESAVQLGADAIVTRRLDSFRDGELPVYNAEQMVKLLARSGRVHAEPGPGGPRGGSGGRKDVETEAG